MTSALATAPVCAGKSIEEKIGDRHPLFFLRTARGWSMRDLSMMSGVSETNISYYERGLNEPTMCMAFKLALALDVTVDKLFGIPYKRNARATVCPTVAKS